MADPPSITCPRCGRTSYHPGDIENRYCGWCKWPTSDRYLGQPEAIAMAEEQGAITPLAPTIPTSPHYHGGSEVLRRRAAHSRRVVQIALAITAVTILFTFAVGERDVAFITAAAWLVCTVIYTKIRAVERQIQ